ncbi:MAG: MBL fold metallo-hydrolase [Bacillota bacterium]|nr:MBL fold metallo-hydrolase [Bacillota bacterium]
MKIANGIEMLECSMKAVGAVTPIYPTLIWDESDVILVDAGSGGQDGLIEIDEKMLQAGVAFNRLNKVIITHQDLDHIGGLPRILGNAKQKVEVISHAEEKPYIQGDRRLVKLTDEAMARLDAMPEPIRNVMKRVFENPPKAPVDKVIADGEELPYCGGIMVIYTPGHTPGHICLYHKPSKTLIAGDELRVIEGKLLGPAPEHTQNLEKAKESLKKLTQYDIEQVICYHGGLFKGDVSKCIKELAGK